METFFDSDLVPPLPGFRLAKLEVYNWGTFHGVVYSVQPRGNTTLLIGENGSGKSTLVDALLTLLVRPQTRNYNVAAGAQKNERDERTYIRGAYDRKSSDGYSPQIQYLRNGRDHYTVILACFQNAQSKTSFTLCQVLYLKPDNSVEKIYAYCDEERSIVKDLGDLQSTVGLAKQLRERGFKATTTYNEYFGWFQKRVRFRTKAMDVFNQTVAVKDVQRLDEFIRRHMLEKQPWNERVGDLLKHFSELSETHRMLVRVRTQDSLLRPIVEEGKRYEERRKESQRLKDLLKATSLYFANETVNLIKPECDKIQQQIQNSVSEIERLTGSLSKIRSSIARLEIDLENSGSEHQRRLPSMIENEEQVAASKLAFRNRFESQLQLAGIETRVTSQDQFHKVRKELFARKAQLEKERDEAIARRDLVQFQIGSLKKQLLDDRTELEGLMRRRGGNLPESFISTRELICKELRLAPSDLPFVAELITVRSEEHEWLTSIEQVLHGFARTLLVSGDFYARVAGFVDKTKLMDDRGVGQRLVYLKVGNRLQSEGSSNAKKKISANSLVGKLEFKADHPSIPWLKSEMSHRFDYLACETVDEFKEATGAAMTRFRHFKTSNDRHEKDDRPNRSDHRNFVLGWDNKAKKNALAYAIREGESELDELQKRSDRERGQAERFSVGLAALQEISQVSDYDSIDHSRHEFEASRLRMELKALEDANDKTQRLKEKLAKEKAEEAGYLSDRDALIAEKANKESALKSGTLILKSSQDKIGTAQQGGDWDEAMQQFEVLKEYVKRPLTLDNVGTLPSSFERDLRSQYDRQIEKLKPAERELTSVMTRFLKAFPDEQSDLDAHVDSLPSFIALQGKISADDLPQHEQRFKKRLNEKVLHDIGSLRGSLEMECNDIRDKIEQLNAALQLLEWREGTFMRLETSDGKDVEILDFRRDLAGCLTGTFDAASEVNETTFLKIKKIIEKLENPSNETWRNKVVDVRNWFNFAAREIVAQTGESRSFYDGGTGQSGGEKGKLAFLVLVAAIAYQYDISPHEEESDRFHFVMVDEMFSRSDDAHAEYALELFEQFKLQLLIVAPLDAKARVTEPYVGTYLHVVKNKVTNCSQLLSITAEELRESIAENGV